MKNSFLIVLLMISPIIFGQKKNLNKDLILFEKALALQELLTDHSFLSEINQDTVNISTEDKIRREYAKELKENILNKVIDNYNELIQQFPKSNLVFRSLNNKGIAELESGYQNKAKETFLKIVKSNANDKEKGGPGFGIMGEPYANYKNRALKSLAKIEIGNKNYSEALQYLEETKKFPYQHFCGNEFAEDKIYIAELYAQCYLGLNQTEKAFDVLLPNIFENGLANNSEIVNLTYSTLSKTYSKIDLKNQLEESFKNLMIKKEKRNKYEYMSYNINFLNRTIELPNWQLEEATTDQEIKNSTLQILKNSKFYALLSK
ncbi:hypothetical protein MKS83_18565 [Chryseobacterium sp. Y16C]|uniref:tetratricopeptide repeat protein n=1 Tax=Chryseobacterium sp. Y16C TaxID=2920939 RepID=UPI001F0B1204|nr:hypothetical protein [Chryseobacterium sp. Y16C]UMQ41380.1 hypothetical protein MKS83_18565 [Chryseobacterium sp. Y16C]